MQFQTGSRRVHVNVELIVYRARFYTDYPDAFWPGTLRLSRGDTTPASLDLLAANARLFLEGQDVFR